MNFLAHLYLSGPSNSIKIGNFIGDYVKGKKYLNYSLDIQRGIILHRNIDHYTDNHPIVAKSSLRFRSSYRKYSGIVVDILYDHFLAKNWTIYHPNTLNNYTCSIHRLLLKNYMILPARVQQFLPFMIQNRRLESYATLEGIERALEIMCRHTSLPDHTSFAIACIKEHYQILEEEFTLFFSEMIEHVKISHEITLEAPDDLHPVSGK